MCGVYCIKVKDAIVYVGKSNNLKERIHQHWYAISHTENKENKYILLRNCYRRKEYRISFWLLDYDCLEEELDEYERFWIKVLNPCLNSQCNGGRGSKLTLQEFYEIIINNKDDVSGMIEYEYQEGNMRTVANEKRLFKKLRQTAEDQRSLKKFRKEKSNK